MQGRVERPLRIPAGPEVASVCERIGGNEVKEIFLDGQVLKLRGPGTNA